jgi:hypothetical protein
MERRKQRCNPPPHPANSLEPTRQDRRCPYGRSGPVGCPNKRMACLYLPRLTAILSWLCTRQRTRATHRGRGCASWQSVKEAQPRRVISSNMAGTSSQDQRHALSARDAFRQCALLGFVVRHSNPQTCQTGHVRSMSAAPTGREKRNLSSDSDFDGLWRDIGPMRKGGWR